MYRSKIVLEECFMTTEDPRKKYYNDEFPKQYQEPPALQKEMDPIPDCGESSYVGSSQLNGKKILVTGGDSGIGRAAAIAYARESADVAINYLPVEQPMPKKYKSILKKQDRKLF